MDNSNLLVPLAGTDKVTALTSGIGWIFGLFACFEFLALFGVWIYVQQTGTPRKQAWELYKAASMTAFMVLAVVLTVYLLRV